MRQSGESCAMETDHGKHLMNLRPKKRLQLLIFRYWGIYVSFCKNNFLTKYRMNNLVFPDSI